MPSRTKSRAPRVVRPDAAPQILLAASTLAGVAVLARYLDSKVPTRLDRAIRQRTEVLRDIGARRLLAPMFPLGLPGGYLAIAYLTARWLRKRDVRGGPAIITSGWLGWIVHRAAKVAYTRERPCGPNATPRVDSYPSGHTTGATALALTAAIVLERHGLLSRSRALAVGIGAPLAMGFYRVIDDEHWATDVMGGWLLGTAIGLGCVATLADAPSPTIRFRTGSGASPKSARRPGRRGRLTSRA